MNRPPSKVLISTLLFIALAMTLNPVSAGESYADDPPLKTGIWKGTINNVPIMLCIEAKQAKYYYAGQSKEINLEVSAANEWAESVQGKVTGQWLLLGKQPDRIYGSWRKPGSSDELSLVAHWLEADTTACNSSTYQRTLLLPGERSSLPLPVVQPMVAAAGDQSGSFAIAAAIKENAELWLWSTVEPVPKLVGTGYAQVGVGRSHTAVIKKDGSLWGWGSNGHGQLGGENTQDVKIDAPVRMGDGFVDLHVTENATVAIRKDGTLWLWGGIQTDAKGNLLTTRRARPILLDKSVTGFAANGDDVMKLDGSSLPWAETIPDDLSIRIPTVDDPPSRENDFRQVARGYFLTAGIKPDDTLWMWGRGEVFGDCSSRLHDDPEMMGRDFSRVAVGKDFAVAVKRDGSVWTWGWLWSGDQLGVANNCRKPTQVVFGGGMRSWDQPIKQTLELSLLVPKMPPGIVSVAAGRSHSALVTSDGALWTWGDNEFAQLASGNFESQLTPRQVLDGIESTFIDGDQTFVRQRDATLWRWGVLQEAYRDSNYFEGERQRQLKPTKVFANTIRLLRYGYELGRGVGLRSDGTLLDWQYLREVANKPTEYGHDVIEITGGWNAGYALKADGTLWQFGDYLGRSKPRLVGENFVHIVGTPYDDYPRGGAYGIKADGTLWSWGSNVMNQLGDGTQIDRDSPVQIGTGFVQVAAGRFHGIALASDGSVWTWGNNEVGVVGDGTATAATKPQKVATGFTAIAAGAFHNLAVKEDGTVWAWGSNEDGQLGDGTTERRFLPVQVYPTPPKTSKPSSPNAAESANQVVGTSKDPIVAVRVGGNFSCARFASGFLKCWGSNADGQFGNENRAEKNPIPRVAAKTARVQSYFADSNSIECSGQGAKLCAQTEKAHPFLRGAKLIAGGCGAMHDGKVRCVADSGGFDSLNVIDGVHDAIALAAASGSAGPHGCVLQADGRVKCWGSNYYGELGNGATSSGSMNLATEVVGLK